MKIVLNPQSSTPLNEQIYSQILRQVADGALKKDECLPSIRFVARELKVGIITVKTAYEKLEADKVIYTVPGKGCFVGSLQCDAEPKKFEAVRDRLRSEVEYAKSMGLSKEEIIEIISSLYEE